MPEGPITGFRALRKSITLSLEIDNRHVAGGIPSLHRLFSSLLGAGTRLAGRAAFS